MTIKDKKSLIKISDDLGWNVDICKKYFEFSKHSPQGQDFFFSITASSLDEVVDEIYDYWESFDTQEEAMIWVGEDGRGKNGAPENITDIIEDMQDCKNMMYDLYEALNNRDNDSERIYTINTKFVFEGEFYVKAKSIKQAKELVGNHCGLVLGGNIHSTLPDDDIDWRFDVHSNKIISK